jgi:hypothetical protein
MKQAGTFKILENWEITRVDSLGNVLSHEKICNLIVNDGLNIVRDLLGGLNSQAKVQAIAIGTGATSPANTDTELDTEYTRSSATISAPALYQVQFTKTFTFASGVSETITEAGLFDSAIVSGSKMLARTTFSGQLVNADVDLIVTAIITISRA